MPQSLDVWKQELDQEAARRAALASIRQFTALYWEGVQDGRRNEFRRLRRGLFVVFLAGAVAGAALAAGWAGIFG